MTLPDFYDLAGAVVPRGRSIRSLTYPASVAGPLPPWLFTQGTTAVSGGYVRVSAASGTIYLRTPGVDLNGVEALTFTVQNMNADWYSGINVGLSLKDDNATAGAAIFQTATGQPTCMLRIIGAGIPDVPINYLWAGPNLIRHRDLTIGIGVADRSVWLLEDDQVMHYGRYPQLRLGPVRGVLDATVTGGQTRELRASQVDLTAESL